MHGRASDDGQGRGDSRASKLRMRTKLAFGVGTASEAAVYIAFNAFNILFYKNVLGLSGFLCGLAVGVALVFDAISDPLVGALSDRVRSRLGRRHPFMYASAIPLGLCFFAIYAPPAGLGELGLFLWLCLGTALLRTAVTFFSVPHLAMGAELSDDYRERSVVMSYSVVFQVVGGALTGFMAWSWFGRAEGGPGVRENFLPMGMWVGGMSALAILVSTHFTRDQIPRMHKGSVLPDLTIKQFFSEIADCIRNRDYRMLLLGLMFLGGTLGLRETLESYLVLFFWELPEKSIRLFHLVTPVSFFVAFAIIPRLHGRLEKRETIIYAVWGAVFAIALPILCRLMGVFPPNGSPLLFPLLLAFVGLFYFCFASLMISVMSALADVVDEFELQTGHRREGLFYSARTFFLKVTTALGHLLGGTALDLIGFGEGVKPGEVAVDVVRSLGWVAGPIAALPGLAAIACYAKYSIDKRRHADTQAQLVQRRMEASVGSAE